MQVFISGVTGYMGRALAGRLVAAGHCVRGLVRPGSESRLTPGVVAVQGDALDSSTFRLEPGETLVHLTGVAHPGPAKAREFRTIDLVSARASAHAAARDRAGHAIYVSVAQPAPVMKAYVAARQEGEEAFRHAGVPLTILRPWYVLGPGHWWPLAILPLYWAAERIPGLSDGARRLGLVTLAEMTAALQAAVEGGPPASGLAVNGVPEIRYLGKGVAPAGTAAVPR
jgi:uncharacterized protein YbjT (DUF2867 family)